ncbi:MAG: hypothetical protein L3J23_04075 [Flavobacteriaceae bacterium]|nr:hypothetical protein [Flavobacteriaceae bacterium]
MSIKATLHIDDKKLNVLYYYYDFYQPTDANNRPSGKPVFQGIRIVLETQQDLSLEEWAAAANQKKQLELHLSPITLGGKTRIVYFIDAHLVKWDVNFTNKSSAPMTETLFITCGGLKEGTVEYEAYWRTTYPNKATPIVRNNQEEAKEITEKEETDYKLDKKGYITRIDKINGAKYDRLYATDANDAIDKSKFIQIKKKGKNDSTLISDLVKNKISYTYLNQDDIEQTHNETTATVVNKSLVFKFFKFAADNSDVEWSVNKYEIMPNSPDYQIGTFFLNNLSPSLRGYRSNSKWLGMVHSHPNELTLNDRLDSLFGDLDVGTGYLERNGKNLPYLIYFPDTETATKIRLGKKVAGKRTAKPHIHSIINFTF